MDSRLVIIKTNKNVLGFFLFGGSATFFFNLRWKHCFNLFPIFGYISGPKMPKGLKGLSAVSISGNLYAFAGLDENVDFQTAIYRLSCSSRNCVWTTMDQELTIARDYAVAMVVPNDICS